MKDVFRGRILGIGSTSGIRVVVGWWHASPLGEFVDVMVAEPDGNRVLIAPSERVAQYVSDTYNFDDCLIEKITANRTRSVDDSAEREWRICSDSLSLVATFGRRTRLGSLLRVVPPVARDNWRTAATVDPIARMTLRGVRTKGTAGRNRREYYAASDQHSVIGIAGRWKGTPLGQMGDVDPPPDFGFSSTPRAPSLVSVTTTVIRPKGQPL